MNLPCTETGREIKREIKKGIKHVKLKVSTSDIKIKQSGLNLSNSKVLSSELKTLELDTLNPDLLILISFVETDDFLNPLFWYTLIGRILGTLVDTDYNNLKIKKKRRSSINLNIHHSKVPSSGELIQCRVFNKPIHYHNLVSTHWNQIFSLKNEKINILLIV